MATVVDEALQPVNEEVVLPPLLELPEELIEVPLISEEPESGPDESSQFDRRYREPFTGLLYLGALEETVNLFGHSFKLVTPSQRERLEAGVLHKQYVNTLSGTLGWVALMVATYLREVDGSSLPEPISADPRDTGLSERYDWVVDNLRGPVIERLYDFCLVLDGKVQGVLNELDRLGGTNG